MASNPISEGASNPSTESMGCPSNRSKSDPAWQYCIVTIKNGHTEIKCMFCNKVFRGGGIRRLKYHISGLFGGGCASCPRVTDEARHAMKMNIENAATLKKNATKKARVCASQNEKNDLSSSSIKRHESSSLHPNDSSNLLSPTFMPRTTTGCQPTIQSALHGQAVKDRVDMAAAKWFYDSSIPFNAVNSVLYQPMINAIASYGKGYEGPNLHLLRGKLLKRSVEQVNEEVNKHRDSWKETGCTLMSDGWSDQNGKSLINFLVYSPKGTLFLKSVDASDASKTAVMLFGLFKEVILFVGAENIVQVVTDNASNYVAAGRLIEAEFPTISWSPCAAHCFYLMFSDIGKLERVSFAVDQASKITKFIYNHCFVLSMMRRFTNGRNLLRPAPTRRELKGRNHDPISFVEFDEASIWVVEEEPPLLSVDEVNALYIEEDVDRITNAEQDNNDLEVSLNDVDACAVDNDDSITDIDNHDPVVHVGNGSGSEAGFQEINNGVETFNFDPVMTYTAMLQEVEGSGSNSRQAPVWMMD